RRGGTPGAALPGRARSPAPQGGVRPGALQATLLRGAEGQRPAALVALRGEGGAARARRRRGREPARGPAAPPPDGDQLDRRTAEPVADALRRRSPRLPAGRSGEREPGPEPGL